MSRAVFCWAKDIYVCRFFSFIKGKRKKWSFSASQISQQVMVHGIIEWSLRNRYIVLIMVAGLFVWGAYSVKNNPIDAIPDLSENQVIVFTEWMGRGPQLIEDQVTYPLVTNLQGLPRIKYVRGSSMFGMSFIYVIFEDDVDIYWARERVLQDWYIKFGLQNVKGVSEIASFGGFQKQYQVTLDPNKLLYYNLSVSNVINAIRSNNNESGGRKFELSDIGYVIKTSGYLKSAEEISNITLAAPNGIAVRVSDIATVQMT